MKQLFTGAVLGIMMFASSAMANVDVSTTEPLSTSMMNTELNQVFDTNSLDQIQAIELSSQEMKDTQGAFWPFVMSMVGGAGFSMALNATSTRLRTGEFPTWQSYALSAGTGAVGGGYANVMLRTAGIPASPFAATAWNSSNRIGNAVIRANGAGIGQSYVGVHKVNLNRQPYTSYRQAHTYVRPSGFYGGQRVIR